MAKAKKPTKKSQAWPLFDAIVDRAPLKDTNPWRADGVFEPDYDTLCRLLAVPLSLKARRAGGRAPRRGPGAASCRPSSP